MAKARAKSKPRKKRASPQAGGFATEPTFENWSHATVMPGEDTRRRITDPEVLAYMARCTQWIYVLGMKNASACSSQRLRLWTSEKNAGLLNRMKFETRRCTNRRRLKYMHDTNRVGKAAIYAEEAGDIEEIMEHPVLDLLHSPNPFMDASEYTLASFLCGEFAGNLYEMPTTEGDVPELYMLYPQWTRPVPSENGFLAGYEYGRDRTELMSLGVDEVYHKKHVPSLTNPYIGASPAHAVLIEADIDNASATRDLSMWRNGARPDSMLLMPPEMNTSKDQVKQAYESINNQFRGPNNSGRVFVTNAAKLEPLQFTPRDMENSLRNADIRTRLCAAFQIPETEVIMADANKAGANTGSMTWMRWGIQPRLTAMAEYRTKTILPLFGIEPGEMWFAYDNCVPEDDVQIATTQVSLYTAAIITKNEARSELGLDPVDGGDDFPEVDDGSDSTTGSDPDAGGDSPKGTGGGKKAATNGRACCDHHRKSDDVPALPDKDDGVFARMQRAIERWLRKVFGSVTDLTVNLTAYAPELQKLLAPFIDELFGIGVEQGVSSVPAVQFDDPMDALPDRGAEWMRNYTVRLSQEITDTMQKDLTEAIAKSIAEGNPIDEATVDVANALQDTSGVRAERIARTETSRAVQNGELEAWKALGGKRWKWQKSANACPVCDALAERVNADGGWPIGKAVLGIGEPLALASGETFSTTYAPIDIALGHPFCRCKMVLVTEDIQ